jgi:peptidoglycan/xylan/chitin deacetylase (PgdA/CDA1 family)
MGSDTPPEGWRGWPDKKKFALVLTHDVDTALGQKRCRQLMDMEKRLGFRSSFNFVPERYNVSARLLEDIKNRGFEVGVHGLTHDGKLYASKEIFDERVGKINKYIKEWGAVGFRSPAMHHNLDWIHKLNIQYDLSTFDTDPFEPQSDGVGTIFPFGVSGNSAQNGYLELPYTLAQDFTMFIIMREKNIDIWKKKLDWIAGKGGMALINTHPDYMHFGSDKTGREEYPVKYYLNFLEYVMKKYREHYWHALPKDMVQFWKSNDLIKENFN